MGFASLLESIRSGATVTGSGNKPAKQRGPKQSGLAQKSGAKSSSGEGGKNGIKSSSQLKGEKRPITRPVFDATIDPAVARLKAARAEERRQALIAKGIDPDKVEKREKAKREKKQRGKSKENAGSTARSKIGSSSTSSGTGRRARGNISRVTSYNDNDSSEPSLKKLNFAELMKQAEKVDGSGLVVKLGGSNKESSSDGANRELPRAMKRVKSGDNNGKYKSETGSRSSQYSSFRDGMSKSVTSSKSQNPLMPMKSSKLSKSVKPTKSMKPVTKARIAGPSEAVRKKLEMRRRRQQEEEEEDSDDGFIVDDEEEEVYEDDPGYDRDEIWAMFNRGKKRQRYDNYSDDEEDEIMEATGADVFEEEEFSTKQALEDDRRERMLEKKMMKEKLARKKRLQRG